MRAIATRALASVLAALVAVSCGTVRESRQPDIGERVFLPRASRAVASPVLEESELRGAIEELLPYVNVEEARAELRRMVADPRFHGRRPEELRVVLASWGSGPAALEEIARGYRAFCAAVRRTNCLEGPLTDSSVYQIAFDFALGSQWDGFAGEVRSTFDPSSIRIVLLTGMVIFMATIAIPELLSKIPAAAATAGANEPTARGLRLENQAADELARAGYEVEQNTTVPGPKNPDLVVEGKVFDVYSPEYRTSTKNIFNAVKDKVMKEQASRVVINLGESSASVPQLMLEFTQRRGEIRQLSEVLVVRKGTVTRIYP